MNLLPSTASLTKKMNLVVMAVSTIAVLTAGSASMYLSNRNYRAHLINDLQGLAQVVGRNCQVALKFNLPGEAEKPLAAFDVRPSVLFAAIFDPEGQLFAVYDPSGRYAADAVQLLKAPEAHQGMHEGHLHIITPIMISREKIGTMVIGDDMSSIKTAMKKDGIILLCVMLIAIGIAYFLTNRLQGLIVGPVLDLARTADRISREKDYSIRAENQSSDETGMLIGAFNAMLDSLQEKDFVLREREERFRAISENAMDAITIADSTRKILYCNRATEQMFGYGPGELIGQTTDVFIPEIFCERQVINTKRYIETGVSDVIGTTIVSIAVKKDGTEFPIEFSLSSWQSEDDFYFAAFTRDITERRRSEENLRSAYATVRAREQELEATNEQLMAQEKQLRNTNRELSIANRELVESREKLLRLATAIEQAEEGISLSDEQGRYTYVNPVYKRITGFDPEELIGNTPTILRNPAQGEESLHEMVATTSRGETWRGNIKIKKKDGVSIDIDMSLSPIRNASGETTSFVSIIRDVSRQLQMELQLQQTQKMEAIGTLAGGIAHDFNNILSAIIGFTEIAYYSDNAPENIRDYLGNVLKASDRAKDLVQQILAFSRMGNQEKKPVAIKPLVKEGLKLLRASIPTTIEIRSSIESDVAVMADPTQIHQILMNLCTNAAHAMEEQGGILDITLKNSSLDAEAAAKAPDLQQGQYVRLTVGDTGTGIDPAIKSKIFEPFFTTKEQGKGTGMGLSVVHGIVKSHGGAINVYSESGKGSTFSVYLPVIAKGADEQKTGSAPMPGGTERILFVDDEDMVVEIGRSYLESLGYTVVTFGDSIEALKAFAENPGGYDLVITDYTMPRMTGYDLACEVLRLRPGLPVILCTGFSETISAGMAKKAGIREFLLKPLNKSDLAQAVRKTLDSVEA
ncbi:MAG: PAS domain S-box protein [Deltaproteobacteria bacterium]|nr:PAS domain S-box protein [Deltaproteobacteria bacterium]